ncbi:MAG TPA: DUF3131 domain-containing protein, partial [Alphaproteobacteria bacterium]|nr:DUF3131 domain-containing protein [Alphaproteobacteria bacterium]
APGAGGNTLVQEGRLGYEEYAARAFALLGYDVAPAQRLADWLEWHDVYGVRVASDSRRAESFGAHVHTTSEPFILAGLEFGLGAEFGELGYRVFQAQRRRFEETGRLTAVSEDHLDRAPRFVYGTVVANGEPWAVVTPDGKPAEPFRLLSTKTAFAFAALFPSPYSDRLREAAAGLAAPQGGWYAGRYEATGETNAVLAANTNAVVLEALHFQAHGPLLAPRAAP